MTVFSWGHRWVVLSVAARLPFCPRRPWALSVLYRNEESCKGNGQRFKTRPQPPDQRCREPG